MSGGSGGSQTFTHNHFRQDNSDSLDLVVRRPTQRGGSNATASTANKGTANSHKVSSLLGVLRREVGAAKLRLNHVEHRLWQTGAQCNHIQEENQALWKLLAENISEKESGGVENINQEADGRMDSASYAAHFEHLHTTLKRITPQAPTPAAMASLVPTAASAKKKARRASKSGSPGEVRRVAGDDLEKPTTLFGDDNTQQQRGSEIRYGRSADV
mmetsp:Transcript_63494/g.119206  ORF Transcript_63494/g.119206 Transcript_63494/m.119206 type:complete len:215 (+) Transcript_63494:393-1037(+)